MPAPRFSAFGQTIESRFPFHTALLGSQAVPTLRFELREELTSQLTAAPVFYQSRRRRGDGCVVQLHRPVQGVGIRLADGVDFSIQPEVLSYAAAGTAGQDEVEIDFFGVALPLWLEMRGVLVFHAACVASDQYSIGLLADCGGGKTTLAMELMRRGFSLLTDDHLAVNAEGQRTMALPAVPEIRLWPEQAERYFNSVQGFRPVGRSVPKLRVPLGESGGSFAASPRRLSALYLVERTAQVEQVTIEPLSLRDALHALLRYSATPLLCEAVGLRTQRLDRLSRLVASVPIRRLRCPDGLEHLAATVAVLQEELSRS